MMTDSVEKSNETHRIQFSYFLLKKEKKKGANIIWFFTNFVRSAFELLIDDQRKVTECQRNKYSA